MTTRIPVPLVCVCICIAAAAICIAGAVSFICLNNAASGPANAAQETGQTSPSNGYAATLSPTSVPTENHVTQPVNPTPTQTTPPPAVTQTNTPVPTATPTQAPVWTPQPTPANTPVATVVPTAVPTVKPTAAPTAKPTPVPTLSPLQKEGISLLEGNWHGSQKIMFVASGTFDAVCKKDFTAYMSGTIKYGSTNNNFNLPVTWEYLGNQKFIAKTGDGSTIPFTCDGQKLTMTVNPQKHIDKSYPDMEVPIEMKKV